MNYVIAGSIMDKFCGSKAEQCLQTHLFDPLSMVVGWGPNPQNWPEILEPWPHRIADEAGTVRPWSPDDGPNDNPSGLNTAGRAHMAMAHYWRFAKAHLSATQGILTPGLNLSLAGFQKLQTAYLTSDISYTYGGWDRVSHNAGHYQLHHDGSNTLNYCRTVIDSLKVVASAVFTNIAEGQTETAVHQLAAKLPSLL